MSEVQVLNGIDVVPVQATFRGHAGFNGYDVASTFGRQGFGAFELPKLPFDLSYGQLAAMLGAAGLMAWALMQKKPVYITDAAVQGFASGSAFKALKRRKRRSRR